MVDSFKHYNGKAGGFRSENIQRRFILFGEKQSGKSSLANLLLFAPVFPTYWIKPTGRMKGFPISEADLPELIMNGNEDTYNSDESLRIQVVDQPESSTSKSYGEYLANCISGIKCSDNLTFLITVNFSSESFSQDEFTKINDASLILAIGGFDFYSNAIIVFTHVDEFDNDSADYLRNILEEKLQLEDHAFLRKLLKLVERRYIFLNAMNLTKTNSNETLRKILQPTTQNPDQTFRTEKYQPKENLETNDQLKEDLETNNDPKEVDKSDDQVVEMFKPDEIIETDSKHESKIIEVLEQGDQNNGGPLNDGYIVNSIKELMTTSDTSVRIILVSRETGEHEGEIDKNSLEFLEKLRGSEKDKNNGWECLCIVVKREKSNCVADTESKKDLKNEDRSKEVFQTENKIQRDSKSENKSKEEMGKVGRNHAVSDKVTTNGIAGLSQREMQKIPKGGIVNTQMEFFKRFENKNEQSQHVPSEMNRRMSNPVDLESNKNPENDTVRILRRETGDHRANIKSEEGLVDEKESRKLVDTENQINKTPESYHKLSRANEDANKCNIEVDTSIQNISDFKDAIFKKKSISFSIVEALKELSSVINQPIRILLIHIRGDFNEKIYANILKLAENNSTGGKKVSEWQYTSILFQLSINDDEFVNKAIKEHSYLRTLIEKVNNRYACVTERMSTDETSRILKDLIRTKFQESDCIKKRTEEPDEINLHKSVSILLNSANATTEKETKISGHIPFSLEEKPESKITLTKSMMLTGQKSEVPLLSYFSLDKMTAAGADERDGQDPGPQYNN